MSHTINVRINRKEKRRLAKIAASQGMTLSAFLRSAATVEARRVLHGQPKPAPIVPG